MEVNDVTKAQFLRFEYVRRSGRINMTDIVRGAKLAGISEDCYETIMWNYSELKDKFK